MFLTNNLQSVKFDEIELFKTPKQSSFLGLPIDVFELLVSFFTPENFTHLTCCSREARLLDKENTLWHIVRKHFTISENVAKLSNNAKKQVELQAVKNITNIIFDSSSHMKDLLFAHYQESGKIEVPVQIEGWFSKSVSYLPIDRLDIINVNDKPISLRGVGLFQNLTFLNIRTGMTQIPNVIYTLKSLNILHLSHNRISKISSKIRFLTQLQYLRLNNNMLNQLPNSIGCLNDLRLIDLGKNQFQDFPSVLLQCRRLNELTLNDNSLKEIPESIALLKNMRKLNFNRNEVVEIPSQIGMLKLEELYLANNQIKHIPNLILQMDYLINFNFNENPLILNDSLV